MFQGFRVGGGVGKPGGVDAQHHPGAQGHLVADPFSHYDIDPELLLALPAHSVHFGLAGLDAAAGKFPQPRHLRGVGPLLGEQGTAPHNGRTDDHLHGTETLPAPSPPREPRNELEEGGFTTDSP